MKRLVSWMLALGMTVSMAACGSETQSSSAPTQESSSAAPASTAQTSPAPAEEKTTKRAAMITAQKLGDKGVTDDTHQGFIRGCEEFGYEPTVVEVESGEYEETLRALCEEGYDIIMPCWSALEDACAKVAQEYPQSKFIMVFSEIDIPNVKAIISAQEAGSYLAGVAAAMTSKSNHIAFIGGSDNPQINKFRAGYEAGAKAANPEIKVDVAWVGSFDDPAKGKELALMLYDQGCDTIFIAAAASSTGVFEAASETGKYVVGCDVDQNEVVPGQVIGSMVINYGDWVYSCFKEENEGGLKFGSYFYGLEGDYLGFLFPKESTYKTDAAIVAAVEQAKADIVSGKITVPTK